MYESVHHAHLEEPTLAHVTIIILYVSICASCTLGRTDTCPCYYNYFLHEGQISITAAFRSALLQHSDHHYCSIQISIQISITSAFRSALLQHSDQHYFSIQINITAAFRSALLQHSDQHYCSIQISITSAFRSTLLQHSDQHYCSIQISITSAFRSALLQHSDQHYCSIQISITSAFRSALLQHSDLCINTQLMCSLQSYEKLPSHRCYDGVMLGRGG